MYLPTLASPMPSVSSSRHISRCKFIDLFRERELTQARAGEILGIKQPHVSALMRGQSGAFSVERLIEFLTALGQDVQITVGPKRKARAEMTVVVR